MDYANSTRKMKGIARVAITKITHHTPKNSPSAACLPKEKINY